MQVRDKMYPWFRICQFLVRSLFACVGGVRIYGKENLPMKGPVILAPNHMSNLDPPAIGCMLPRNFQPMAKEELFKVPVLGFLLKSWGVFPVRRGTGDKEAFQMAIRILESGGLLLMFPEGTRGDGVTMGPINRGICLLAKRGNAQVVPIGVNGSQVVMPKGAKFPKWHRITVRLGEPFTLNDIPGESEKEKTTNFAHELERRIRALCAQDGLMLKSAFEASESPECESPANKAAVQAPATDESQIPRS
ncbi:MAG: 1-acyl-sn-glycerol-3-phosphate acyltransferase [Armatimonadetes bacterium]|nr:1-acyl-sn-glycerol-3-phosphate acyltransferase [Armatimonadota bacterium]